MRHQNWQPHVRDEIVRDAPKHLFPKPRIAERAGNHHIGAQCGAVACEVLGQLVTGRGLRANR